jgi:hypothetical protein
MKSKITSTVEIIDDEEITIWRLEKDDGTEVININKLFDEDISNCFWQDEDHKFLIVEYYNWDSTEQIAIINNVGKIVRKEINSIEDYIEKQELFIINISGYGLGNEAAKYDLSTDNWKMAVIGKDGKFIIPPNYDQITFKEDENIFYAEKFNSENKFKFSIDGKSLK